MFALWSVHSAQCIDMALATVSLWCFSVNAAELQHLRFRSGVLDSVAAVITPLSIALGRRILTLALEVKDSHKRQGARILKAAPRQYQITVTLTVQLCSAVKALMFFFCFVWRVSNCL